jgi:hypothetical protein
MERAHLRRPQAEQVDACGFVERHATLLQKQVCKGVFNALACA